MNAFQHYVKKLESNPNIPPDIALLFKLGFLNIERTSEQGKACDAWIYASKANDRLFDRMLMLWHTKFAKSFTFEERIQELAAYTTITPHSIELLDKFFQHTATAEEKDELDEWLHESPANDQLFEHLLESDNWQTKSEIITLLRKLVSQMDTGIFPV